MIYDVYKCRWCGQEVAVQAPALAALSMKDVLEERLANHRRFDTAIVHECNNDSIGVAHFIGMRRTSDAPQLPFKESTDES